MDDIKNRVFDLANPHDLKEVLLYAISAYSDYRHYWLQLENIDENFDETLEHNDFASWIQLGRDPQKADDLAYSITASLRETSDLMRQIFERSKQDLTIVLKAIIASPPDIQMMVCGRTYDVPDDEVDSLLEDLYGEMMEMEYEYSMPDALKAFLKVFNDFMETNG
ncbi:hypothetical protein LJC60_06750 [Ruminococcaceae bacterium OttesenSCG-928-D13]|nr:hypothetical protein [Ruminococcaceae bacterium OttesenSCG-928-D13]